MTNAVQRQDKEGFAVHFQPTNLFYPYKIVALIPAGFTRPLPLPSIDAIGKSALTIRRQEHSVSIDGPARRLRCRSHWPPRSKYLLFIPLRPSLSPCPCHCAVIISEISSLLADRPIDIGNPVLPSVPIFYILPNVVAALNCSSEQHTRLMKWTLQMIPHGFQSSFDLPIKRHRYLPRQTSVHPSSQSRQTPILFPPQPQKARPTSSKITKLLRSYGFTNSFSCFEAPYL
jgi:hypothetical protein